MARLWEKTNYKLAHKNYKIRLNPILQTGIVILTKLFLCPRRHEMSPLTATVSHDLMSVILDTLLDTNLSHDKY